MQNNQKKSVYKSPDKKLIRFFETSRNKWKAKARESKRVLKRLKNRIRFLEASRARWKDKAKRLEGEVAQMKARERTREAELATLKKSPMMRESASTMSTSSPTLRLGSNIRSVISLCFWTLSYPPPRACAGLAAPWRWRWQSCRRPWRLLPGRQVVCGCFASAITN